MSGLAEARIEPIVFTEPVEIMVERDHAYKKKEPDPETGKKRIGCAECNGAKRAAAHLGAPPSLNDGGSGMNRMDFAGLKKAWQERFTYELERSPLPRGLSSVFVEGQIGFPTRTSRDEGNYRWMIEKALGDALVKGGWLDDDCFFPVLRYSFGGLTAVHVKGRSFTRLMLMPSF